MSVQSVEMTAMFGWVMDSFRLLRKKPAALMSASVVTLIFGIALCIPMWTVMMGGMMESMKTGNMPMGGMGMGMGTNTTLFYGVYAITVILGLLLMPPLVAGWIRLCRNIDHNQTASAFDIFQPYKNGALWFRGIAFAFLGFLIYAAIFGLLALIFGDAITEYMQQMQQQQLAALSGAPPPPFEPALILGIFLGYFVFLVLALALQFIYMTGFVEVALRDTSAIGAMKLALQGVLKNALKLIVFVLCLFVAAMMVFMIFGFVLVIGVTLLSFIHPVIGMIVGAVFYTAFLLCIYPLMFAGHYFVWKSILGGEHVATQTMDQVGLSA
jgi:hypothetical protein